MILQRLKEKDAHEYCSKFEHNLSDRSFHWIESHAVQQFDQEVVPLQRLSGLLTAVASNRGHELH